MSGSMNWISPKARLFFNRCRFQVGLDPHRRSGTRRSGGLGKPYAPVCKTEEGYLDTQPRISVADAEHQATTRQARHPNHPPIADAFPRAAERHFKIA